MKKKKRTGAGLIIFLLILGYGRLEAAYVKRYSTIANGGMTYTGNTLGLSKRNNANQPGTEGSIGTFITIDTTKKDNTYPNGTTPNWQLNSASAVLILPAGSTVLYAELIWGGSYNYAGQNVYAYLNGAITLATPSGTYSINPASTTAATLSGENYYVRSADVTAQVQLAGAGTYTVGKIPGTEGNNENNANACGWTLAVIYEHTNLAARNMTIFVGAELTSSAVSTTSSVSGFCTPSSGPILAYMMVSAIEGDSNITGDQMQFGPTIPFLAPVSGPNNPSTNFFCSQINNDAGTIDTSGTFGNLNHKPPGTNLSGMRQGWDITKIDVSTRMQNSQSSAYAKGTTTGDRYVITSIGLQIDVGAPIFPSNVMTVNKAQTYIGDILTYTINLNNNNGTADATGVFFTSNPPAETSFKTGTLTINGVPWPGADPGQGVSIGTIAAGNSVLVTYQVQVNAIPIAPTIAQYQTSSRWTYQYQSCPGFPINNGTIITNSVITYVPRLVPTKSAQPSGQVLPGEIVTYTITVPNTGTAGTIGTTLTDSIPVGTSYVPNSTSLNGFNVPDVLGQMPYVGGGLINSPGDGAGIIRVDGSAVLVFRVTINPMPPEIITNIAVIDPDGTGGPAPPIEVAITNPPVIADLAVTITDNQTTAIPGAPIIYLITVSNIGPNKVISATLSVIPSPSLEPSLTYTPSVGLYNQATGQWTGFTLLAGQSIYLTVQGVILASASGSLTTTTTVAPSPGIIDPNLDNNTASDTDLLTPQADLGVTKSDDQTVVQPGSMVAYTITVSNAGPSRVRSLFLIDILPAELLNPVFTPSQGVYNTDTHEWTGLNLIPPKTVTMTLTGLVDPNISSGTLVNRVIVTPPAGVVDPNPDNNTALDTNIIGAALVIEKSVDKTTANPGEEITYSVIYRNEGIMNLQDLVISEEVPAFTTFLSASFGPLPLNLTGCTISSPEVGETGSILWNFSGTIAPGSFGTVSFQVILD